LLTGFDLCRAALSVTDITAPEQSVLMVLAIMANDQAQCWPAINGAAGLTGKTKLSERAVQRAIQRLKDLGHLTRKQQRHGCVYTVHPLTPATQTPVPETGDTLTPVRETPVTQAARGDCVAPKQPRTTNTSPEASPPTKSRARKAAPAIRLPADWKPARCTEGTVAREVIDRRGQEWARVALESFRAWAANAEDKDGRGRKRDWQAAWGNWIIEQDKRDGRRTERVDGKPDLRGSRPDPALDLLRAARAAEEAERSGFGWPDHRGVGAALPAVGCH
jgi:hypothetical protein